MFVQCVKCSSSQKHLPRVTSTHVCVIEKVMIVVVDIYGTSKLNPIIDNFLFGRIDRVCEIKTEKSFLRSK